MEKKRVFELFNENELIEPVTPQTITNAFAGLAQGKFHVLILEASPTLENSPFIQVAWEKGLYTIEIQFDNEGQLQQFRKETGEIEECLALFLNYLSEKLPDKTDWQDVSAEINYYYDDEEAGVARETSHPFFVKHFTDDIYYNITDDYAPFGNDTGNDALRMLEERLAEDDDLEDFEELPAFISTTWGFDYLDSLKIQNEPAFIENHQSEVIESNQITVAVGFGVIKITGGISFQLKKRAILALEQLANAIPEGRTSYQQQIEAMKTYHGYDE
ncbi:hypothetical protein ACYSNR_05885 [Enterococcus sp. LJL128]